ncbi:unnamed protein product [Callosobruchus maculatus]|uniref:Uncharacterized protein n=1 Tax=Callosobruchus maculatus TaxID=64391 RepID=A0A653C3A1_CALMS|nr:unnamed protein product [Callosobruchus maculatus]
MSQISRTPCLAAASTTPYLLSGIGPPEASTWTWVYQWNANKGWMRYPVQICRCRPWKPYPLTPSVTRSSVPTVPIYNPIRKCNSMTNPFTHVIEAVKRQYLSNLMCLNRGCGRCFANTSRANSCYYQQQARLPLKTKIEPLKLAVTGCNDIRKYMKNCTGNGTKECTRHVIDACTNQCSKSICLCQKSQNRHEKSLTTIQAMTKQNFSREDIDSYSENALTAHKQDSGQTYMAPPQNFISNYDHGDQKAVEKFEREVLSSPTNPSSIFYITHEDPQPEMKCEKETMISTTQDCIQHQYYQVPCCKCGKSHYQQQTIVCGSINRNEPPQRLTDKMSKTRSAESCCKCRGKTKDLRKHDENRGGTNRKDPKKCSCACTCNLLTPSEEICDIRCPVKESCTQSEFGGLGQVDEEIMVNPAMHSREVSAYSMHQRSYNDQMDDTRWPCKGPSNPCCSCPGSPARMIEQRNTRITPCMLRPPCNKDSHPTVPEQYSCSSVQRPQTPPGSTCPVMNRQQCHVCPPTNRTPPPVQGPRRVCDSPSRNNLRNRQLPYGYATSRGTGTGDLCVEAPEYWSGDTMPFQKHRSMTDFPRPADRLYDPAPTHPLPAYVQRNFPTQPYGDRVSANPSSTIGHKISRERAFFANPSPVDRIYDDDGAYEQQTPTPVFMTPSRNMATYSSHRSLTKSVRFLT